MKKDSSFPPLLPQLLELLRCGLWNQSPDPALFRTLTPGQWLSLLLLSQQQGITGLVSDSALRLPEACQPPGELRLQWFGYNQAVRQQQKLFAAARNEVLGWFAAAGIRCAVFKGDTLNSLYPVPGLRMNGDVDLWLPDADGVDRAMVLLRERGIEVQQTVYHDEVNFTHQHVTFELQKDFLNLPFSSRAPRTLVASEEACFSGHRLHPEADTVMILTHAARHFIEMGLGLRHLCDWAVWLHRYGSTPEVQRGLAEICRLGAGVFLTEFTALAVFLLGLDHPEGEALIRRSRPQRRERLLRELLLQGNLGKEHSSQKHSGSRFRYYGKAFLRELSLSPFWPRFVLASLPHQIQRTWHRISSQ